MTISGSAIGIGFWVAQLARIDIANP